MERVIIYTRVSGKRQRDNQSKPVQLAQCKEFAELRNWQVVKEFHDVQSGKDFYSRENLQNVLTEFRLKRAEYVIFSVLDRLGRSFDVFEKVSKEIYDNGGKIAIAENGKVYRDYDEFWFQCLKQIADSVQERLRIKKRTGDGRMRAFLSGSYSKRPPYGYVIKPIIKDIDGYDTKFKILEIVKPQQESIITILEMFCETRNKWTTVKRANEMKLFHHMKPNGEIVREWQVNSVNDVINNLECYSGKPVTIKWRETKPVRDKENGELKIPAQNPEIEYTYPQIISDELYKRVKESLSLYTVREKGKNLVQPFAKLVYCNCGRKAYFHHKVNLDTAMYGCGTGGQAKYSKYMGTKVYQENPHMHLVSVPIFARALKRFISAIGVNDGIDNPFLNMAQMSIVSMFREMEFLQDEFLSKYQNEQRELLQERQNLFNIIKRYNPQTDFELIKAYDAEIVSIQKQLEQVAENQSKAEKRIAAIKSFLSDLSIPVTKSVLKTGFLEMETIVPDVAVIQERFSALATALETKDWDKVNRLMVSLGLRFTADFAEPNRTKRRQTVRVEFTKEWDETGIWEIETPENNPDLDNPFPYSSGENLETIRISTAGSGNPRTTAPCGPK